MSIVRIEKDNIERYELLANPRVQFASSSSGITGSLPLFADGSTILKDIYQSPGLYTAATPPTGSQPVSSGSAPSAVFDSDVESVRSFARNALSSGPSYSAAEAYMAAVHAITSSNKFSKNQEVLRFEPSVRLDPNFIRKKVVRQSLLPYYRHKYPTLQWNYTNYHTLNFVTGGNLPTNSVIIYPAGTGTYSVENKNALAPSSSFTFDFYINPRYTQENIGQSFSPGTIFHMSSCYALSLVTGTQKGLDGKISGFRLLLQLSQSAEISPSSCNVSGDTVTAPGATADPGFLFVSKDNSLSYNTWHHIGVRWGGPNVNQGSGSFVVDGVEKGTFVIASQSCMQSAQVGGSLSDPDAMFLGNFFEGINSNGVNCIAGYFNEAAATDEGVTRFGSSADSLTQPPPSAQFRHPLNAELHEVKIFQTYRSDQQLLTSSLTSYPFNTGSTSMTGSQDLLFYVPPFFTKTTLPRKVLQTPFQALDSTTTDDPFNVSLSFGVAGHELNLENFVTDFVRGTHPRLLYLTSSEITTSTEAKTANYFLYSQPSTRKRNITVLPCDNGRFYPNFNLLLKDGLTSASTGNSLDRFVNDFGCTDTSIIKLNDMVSSASLLKVSSPSDEYTSNSGSLLAPLLSSISLQGNVDPGVGAGEILTILQRTGDTSSNEVVFFDISNMFYGDKIKPGSVVLTDLSVTGSEGRLRMTLKDDGYGNLYRANATTPPATWSSVGNVVYEEGILVVKSPNVPMFGSDSWEISFEGQRNIHVFEVNVPAPKSLINSSTNPTYMDLIPSDYPSENAKSFVYVTGIQLHDDNLNVIGRANLAQPVIKRDGDRILFRLRMDY